MERCGLKNLLYRRARTAYPYALALGKAADIRGGSWQEPELKVIQRCLRPGQTAIDIGANYGLWSYHLSRAVGVDGRVIAFEPVPETAAALRRVLTILGVARRVQVLNAGAGERNERASFQIPLSDSGIPSGGLAHLESAADERAHLVVQVELCRVDEVAITGEVALLKVDVEGAELYALRGAERTLREHEPVIVCEIGARLLKERFGIEVADLIDYLAGIGYLGPMKLMGAAVHAVDLAGGHDGNYIFATARRMHVLGTSAVPI